MVLKHSAVLQTLGRLENGEASMGIQNNKEDEGAEAVADLISGEPLQEASSDGAAEDAPAHEPGSVSKSDLRLHLESLHLTTVAYTSPERNLMVTLVAVLTMVLQLANAPDMTGPHMSFSTLAFLQASAVAEALAPRLSGNSSVQLGSAAESEAAPLSKSKAIGPPGLPKRLRDRPRDMPGTVYGLLWSRHTHQTQGHCILSSVPICSIDLRKWDVTGSATVLECSQVSKRPRR